MIERRLSFEDEGRRADKFVASWLSAGFSKVQKMFRRRQVRLDGEPLKAKDRLPAVGLMSIVDEPARARQLTPNRKIRVPIVYQDPHLCVLFKRSGLVVSPGPGHGSDTLISGLLAEFPQLSEMAEAREWGLVHRLDKGTSGLMVVALSVESGEALIGAFAERRVSKRYLALVGGGPEAESGVCAEALVAPSAGQVRGAVDGSGVEAETAWTVLERFGDESSLLALEPRTGRTHQIRLHCQHMGCPVLGDELYGEDEARGRLMLHAERLAFEHPVSGEPLSFEAAPPRPFRQRLKRLRKRFG